MAQRDTQGIITYTVADSLFKPQEELLLLLNPLIYFLNGQEEKLKSDGLITEIFGITGQELLKRYLI